MLTNGLDFPVPICDLLCMVLNSYRHSTFKKKKIREKKKKHETEAGKHYLSSVIFLL